MTSPSFAARVPPLLVRPSESIRYLVYCRAYALASAIRLTLPDALQEDWLAASVVHWVGVLLLVVNGSLLGWLLCAAGLVYPLLFLSDQLTQPVYLLLCALGAIGCFVGSERGRDTRMALGLPAIVRPLTVGTYAVAGLHKLNRDFFDPAVSCANGGVRLLGQDWAVLGLEQAAVWPGWPVIFVVGELTLAALFVLRPSAALVFGLALHLPLTIVFAPAFAFTMASGWVATLTREDLDHLADTVRQRWRVILPLGGVPAFASLSRYPAERWRSDPDWCVKEAVLWLALAAVLVAWARTKPDGAFGWFGAWRERAPRVPRVLAFGLTGVWVVNGLLPYTGLQFQHSGAMLSNLRIDRGCWNSLVFPESLRWRDEYVRIDSARLGPPPGRPEAERRIVAILWNVESLQNARARWCRGLPQPIRLGGTFRERPFEVDDFCGSEGWVFGEPMFPDYRAFQVNLTRECPQQCVH